MTTSRLTPRTPAITQFTSATVQSLGDSIVDRPSAGATLARQLFDDVRPTLQRAPEGGRMVVVSAHHRLDDVTRLGQYYEAMGKSLMAAHLYAAAALSEVHPLADVAQAAVGCVRLFDLLPKRLRDALHAQIAALRAYDVLPDGADEALDKKLGELGDPDPAMLRKASHRVASQRISEALKSDYAVSQLQQVHLCASFANDKAVQLVASVAIQVRGPELKQQIAVAEFLERNPDYAGQVTQKDLDEALAMLRGDTVLAEVKAPEVKAGAPLAKSVGSATTATPRKHLNKNFELRYACKQGDLQTVRRLVADREVKIDEAGPGEYTALWWACARGKTHVVKALLDARADFDTRDLRGRSPLWIACHHGHTGVVKLLLNADADVHVCDNRGVAPALEAHRKGHKDIVKLIGKKIPLD